MSSIDEIVSLLLAQKVKGSSGQVRFDLANFDAYTRALLTHPDRLDANHRVFAYRLLCQAGL
ncbi:hypothetical protein [Thiothrix eikelboomii]|uniref:hypothetical protein n=1 Tax=Thiothrix eikelboomii TaxID=92487 RepID=UPI003BB00F1D